ncbi:hypothetical protein GWI33_013764 [Rhynchophorus ferrugineus]|uniref:Pre-rRNA-processing protein TSR2 homolog n=1 Tax=Rhynchophorus ferrugineus TaxID=354439 RepID=A0A834M6B5_RHYFE|nr:hypothetical protein GWI33_013764 [Rhynchophorus ferrugineus]
MEEPFTKIVTQIFNNWTALKLAVEHSMGGPDSKQAALDFRNYMVQYCLYEHNVDIEGIQDALEDILDQEFETICEDDSPKQIAHILYRFTVLLKEGKTEECDTEFQKLPSVNADWLNQQVRNPQPVNIQSSSDSSDDDVENTVTPMEDDGWTEVKGRRRK